MAEREMKAALPAARSESGSASTGSVKRALSDRETAGAKTRGTVGRALPEREAAKPRSSNRKVQRALPVGRSSSR